MAHQHTHKYNEIKVVIGQEDHHNHHNDSNYHNDNNYHNDSNYHNNMHHNEVARHQEYLSWRKLLLSKAKLKAASTTSGLMSGFAMVAMVEIQLDQPGNLQLPPQLCILFSVLTTFLISVHVFALMISVCILPNIETVNHLANSPHIQDSCQVRTHPADSPYTTLRVYIEIAWIFSTGLGSLLFLMEIPVLIWVKFFHVNRTACVVATAIMIPVCVLFLIFSLKFYKKLVRHKQDRNVKAMEGLELILTKLNDQRGDVVGGCETPQIRHI